MDPRRLELLLELSRQGSMRAVADTMRLSTSSVSQQIAVLSREAGAELIEREGRRVRLTPAGKRLAAHAVTILAAIETARVDLDPDADPAGAVRVASFATAAREILLPVTRILRREHPGVQVLIHEHEPAESLALLDSDDVDLALTYDYNLAPSPFDRSLASRRLWSTTWALGVSAGEDPPAGGALATFARVRDRDWVVNSRNSADEEVVGTIASMAGYAPSIAHRVDSLDLVQDLIAAGLGVGLLPAHHPTLRGVALWPLTDPEPVLRAYAVTRRGRTAWPPLAVVLRLVEEHTRTR